MTATSTPPAAAPRLLLPHSAAALRQARGLQWLGHRGAYTVGVMVVTVLGAGTTLIAPRLLGPVAFGTFALLTSLFQYATKADLGLSQLADKQLTLGNSADADAACTDCRWFARQLF
jgi:hypothetical protein